MTYVRTVKAYAYACIDKKVKDLSPGHQWWYHRARAEIDLSGFNDMSRARGAVISSLKLVPPEFYHYVKDMLVLL